MPTLHRLALVPASILCASALGSGCRSAASAHPEVEAEWLGEASYSAAVVHQALRLEDASELGSGLLAAQEEPVPDGPFTDVETRILCLPRGLLARSLSGEELGKCALRIEREAGLALLERWLSDGAVEELSAPRLSVVAGRPAQLKMASQTAFLEGYEIVGAGPILCADPSVGVAEEGLGVTLTTGAPDAEGCVSLELELVFLNLEQPMRRREIALPGLASPVEVQEPLTTRQALRATATLGPKDMLVLGSLADASAEREIFAFVTCEPASPR
jgi:hypothetical protein